MKAIRVPQDAVVLCVDDDLARRHFYLSKHRLPDVFVAHEVAEAIELIDRVKPSWIFLDYDLAPGIDSTAIAEHLSATNFAGTVVIVSENPFGQAVLSKLLSRAVMAALKSSECQAGSATRFSGQV
jgi:CheY-like chemotaxis protein